MQRWHVTLGLVNVLLAATLPVGSALAAPTCFGKRATIVGSRRDDRLVGTRGNDVIVGRGGDDLIRGRGGRDRICGGAGEDELRGGRGRDRLRSGRGDPSGRGSSMFGNRGNDILIGSRDGETMFGGKDDDVLRARNGNRIYFDELHGGKGDDVLKQGAEGALLVPGTGDDRVDGGSNDSAPPTDPDLLDLSAAPGPLDVDLESGTATGEGSDVIDNVEVVVGGAFDDKIAGGGLECCPTGFLRVTLYGMGGDDVLAGGAANDLLIGDAPPGRFPSQEPGDDTIIGGEGDDSLRGGPGDDEYVGGSGEDTVLYSDATGPVTADLGAGQASGEGSDALRDIENLTGTGFDDTLIGDEGDNRLDGLRGSDTLRGGGGNDTLVAPKNDEPGRLEGGTGRDTVAYRCVGIFTGVDADLQSGSDSIGNTLTGIENLGGNCSGTFSGDQGPNRLVVPGELFGRGGDDVLIGRSTDDVLHGGDGDDVLDGGRGTDSLDGGPDTDVCVHGEQVVNCET